MDVGVCVGAGVGVGVDVGVVDVGVDVVMLNGRRRQCRRGCWRRRVGLSECVAASSVPAHLSAVVASVTSATVSSAMALVTMVVLSECVDVGVCDGVGVGDGVVYAGVDVGDDRWTSASVSTLV